MNHKPLGDSERTLRYWINRYMQFKPMLVERNGKRKLQEGEQVNNALLALHLKGRGISKVDREVRLKNRSRADSFINGQIIIECKQHLLSVKMMNEVSSQIRRIKRLNSYKAYALIYGDAKRELLKELENEIGEGNAIVLGEVIGY